MGKQQWIGGWFSGAKPVSSSKQVVNSSDDHAAREQYAENLMNQGDLQEAEKIYRELIAEGSSNHIVYGNLAKICGMQGRVDELMGLLEKTLELNPLYPEAHNYLGNAHKQRGDLPAAIASYSTAIQLNPGYPKAHNNLGNALKEQGDLAAAIASYNTALQLQPDFLDAHNNLGIALQEQGDLAAAIASYNTALQLQPSSPGVYNNLGNALKEQGDLTAAIASYNTALQLQPSSPGVYNNLGNALKEQGDLAAAIASYDTALQLQPNFPDAHNNLGNALKEQGDLAAAIASYSTALQLQPSFSEAHNNLGNALKEQGDLAAAIASYNTALQLQPNFPGVYNNLGNALKEQGDLAAAIASYNTALQLQPSFSEVHNNLGNALKEQGDLAAAIASYNTALQLQPNFPFVLGSVAHLCCQICQWSELGPLVNQITQGVSAGEPITDPFSLLALVDDSHLHRQAASIFVREEITPTIGLGPFPAKLRGEKIHIAYLSADFHDHATIYLMAELFELHDRDRFEITAISFGPSQGTTMRQRVEAAVDRFEEVRNTSDIDVARLCRKIGVDLAIDLKGFTRDYRAGILAHRCAPIQVNWLGYPGTMAAPFIDYIVADHTLISEDSLPGYSEKVIWLPDCYQVNDGKRAIALRAFTRSECGLPESGFVFCCFNNNYKILPHTFDVWMRILARVPGSVLWLLEDNPEAVANLSREALARGIAPKRIVFAKRMPVAEHLARHRLADLFIDTWPYNAHTTASDALWTGLPVLTRVGCSFASRVAASLLQAIGLPELITRSDQHYEDLAVALAHDPFRLQALRQKLAANRLIQPLFNCERFTRSLESAFVQVMERHWTGAEPHHMAIAAPLLTS